MVTTIAVVGIATVTNTQRPTCSGVPAEGAFWLCGPVGGAYEVKAPLGWGQDFDEPILDDFLSLVSGYGPDPAYLHVYVRNAHAVPASLSKLAKQIREANRKGGSSIVDPVRFTTSNHRRVALWQETGASSGGSELKYLVAVLLVGDLGEYLMAVYSDHPDTYSLDTAERKVSELVRSVRRLN